MTKMDFLKKTVATLMMALTFMAPMSNAAYAAPKGGPRHAPSVKVSRHMPAPRHKAVPRHSPVHPSRVYHGPSHHRSSDAAAVVIGGLILSTILGSAIANADSD